MRLRLRAAGHMIWRTRDLRFTEERLRCCSDTDASINATVCSIKLIAALLLSSAASAL